MAIFIILCVCVRTGFPSWDDDKYLCKTKLTCHLHQGPDCSPNGKAQQPHLPFSSLSAFFLRMLGMTRCCPGLCLASAKVRVSGRKKGRGTLA